MKPIYLLVPLLAVSVTAAGAQSQTADVQVSRDIRAVALKAALAAEYDAYVDAYYANQPGTMEGLVQAILYWSPLDRFPHHVSERTRLARYDSRRGSGAELMQVHIDSVSLSGNRAIVTVTKHLTGDFLQGSSTRRGRVEGYVLSKHLWMNMGTEWRLMTTMPVEAWIKFGGKAFTIPARAFDPNRSFSMKDIIESSEQLPR